MTTLSFTCITCRVAFGDADFQRSHYKTDWHKYNLKRKVAELPPVTAENFQQRVLAQRAQDSKQGGSSSSYCQLCNKQFSTENAFENHVKSKKHKENEDRTQQQQGVVKAEKEKNIEKGHIDIAESEKGSDSKPNDNTSGQSSSQKSRLPLRSKVKSADFEAVEDDDMLSDTESVDSWEGEALGLEECLFCSKVSKSLDSNIKHMTVSHSFFLPDAEYLIDLEGLITYLGEKVGAGNMCLWCNERGKAFYSTKAAQQHMVDKGHCKMLHEGDALLEYSDFYDYRSSYPDYEEGVDVEMGEDGEEEEVTLVELEEDNYQLVLPSGNSVGHRSLMRYYRQNLPPQRKVNKTSVDRVLGQYRALGWQGSTGDIVKKKVQDLNFIQRQRQRFEMRVGMQQNKLPKPDRNRGLKA